MKYTYDELLALFNSYNEIGKTPREEAYEIAKNIILCSKQIGECETIIKQMHSQFADKDEKGVVKQTMTDGKLQQSITNPTNLNLYNVEFMKFRQTTYEIDLIPIKKETITDIKLAWVIVPLLDKGLLKVE
jgi:hypothetical protein